jgi:hypothetical protein
MTGLGWMTIGAIALGVLGIALGLASFAALFSGRLFAFVVRAVFGTCLVVAGGLLGLLSLGTEGAQALAREDVAARIALKPLGPQRTQATVRFADGRSEVFEIAGDEIYIDAHILKWTPAMNRFGLHTSYRLDRIGGRYRTLAQENTSRRTIHALSPPLLVDLVALRQRAPTLMNEVLDAEYGSATFVPVTGASELEVRVSTSGLLVRPASAAP